jgi:hypothetical protein
MVQCWKNWDGKYLRMPVISVTMKTAEGNKNRSGSQPERSM